MLCKSIDWFLYDNGLRHKRVKLLIDEDDEDLGDIFETAKPAVPDQHDMVRKRREDEGMKEV